MGIVEEDIDRVRAATDFIAVASEHIALKRVGRQYQGLCPFHSEKSPSFSINPEKGVYYCYGCQASGDVITFVREVEKLDFAQAVERLASKAGISLRYDSEAAGRDRIKRTRLVEAMEQAVDWYHQRLLSSPDAGPARAYLRSRGYDGAAIRQFRMGWAPDGWDTLCKSLKLPTDVAKDTGLGFVNKVGKVNDFFQRRILFPIFDQGGQPVAFGGRKLPNTEGPKYKNSSETKLYSKSRVLYGLNWAKANIVETGEVIVCEGYTDVIGFHLAGLPRAVATCGTSLADEHFRTLKNYARRIVLGYDADNAGQNAAAKFFAWEKQYEIDLYVVALPPGADPADVAREDPQRLHEAVAHAKPFLQFRVERAMNAANLSTAEGRARAYEAAAAVVMEHPSPIVREQYLREVAFRCQVSEDSMARTLAGTLHMQPSPASGGAATKAGPGSRVAGRREATSTTRPAAPTPSGPAPRRPASASAPSGEGRAVANEDPGAEWEGLDGLDVVEAEEWSPREPYDGGWDDRGRGAPRRDGRGPGRDGRQGHQGHQGQQRQRGGGSPPWQRTAPPRPDPGANGRSSAGRATSTSLRARAAEQRSQRAEEEALRWAVQDPARVLGWLHPVLFADPVHVRAVELLLEHGDVLHAADAVRAAVAGAGGDPATPSGSDGANEHEASPDRQRDVSAVRTLQRLAVAVPLTEDIDDALSLVVSNAAARVIDSIMRRRDVAHPDEFAAVRSLKLLVEALHEPDHRIDALTQLVPWLASWDAQRKQVTRDSAPERPTNESN